MTMRQRSKVIKQHQLKWSRGQYWMPFHLWFRRFT